MSSKVLERTIEAIRRLDRARALSEVCGMLLEAARQYGAEYILAGVTPLPGASRQH